MCWMGWKIPRLCGIKSLNSASKAVAIKPKMEEKAMKKRVLIGLALICCMLCLPFFAKKAKAATTEIFPKEISSPGQISDYMDLDEGIVYTKANNDGTTIYTIKVNERGWVLFYVYGSDKTYYTLYRNASLTAEVGAEYNGFVNNTSGYKRFYYLDEGTYYIKDTTNGTRTTFAYYLPNSAAISHTLKKAKDNSSYTDTVTFTPNLGTTYLVPTVVGVSNIRTTSTWSKASTNATDEYLITDNGEYTVKAVFTDSDWKDFPVMYSFSVYDIGKETKDDKAKDDSKTTDAKLNVTSKTIKVGESFKLKMTGTKVVSFKSSKKSVAKVSSSGKVVGKKKGSATIKVTCENGETYTCKVKVTK